MDKVETSRETFSLLEPVFPAPPKTTRRLGRIDLAQIPWLRPLLRSHWPQFLARSLTLAGFVFSILAGLFGSVVGSHNFAIIFVWIAWWTALKLGFIPLGGRSWCSVCPIPLPGDWLQQGSLLGLSGNRRGLQLRWPKRLRGYWLQAGGFLLIGLFSAVTLTDARVTAWVLLGLFLLATVLSLAFERRAFCSYLCPIGGFTAIYAQAAPVEVRIGDPEICRTHSEKICYQNCPWGVYPVALQNSAQCGLCMECLRVCPRDNILVNLRPFGQDIGQPRPAKRLDEAFLALVMSGSAIAFSAVFLGPWGGLKSAAFAIGSPSWLMYSLGFLALTLGILPGLFSLAVWVGEKWTRSRSSLRQAIADQSQALLPLGLFTWIAFTIAFAFPKLSLVVSVLSDPFGWGWDLFGTANPAWSLDGAGLAPVLQIAALIIGLVWSVRVAEKISRANNSGKPVRSRAFPVIAFCFLYTQLMFWLLIG